LETRPGGYLEKLPQAFSPTLALARWGKNRKKQERNGKKRSGGGKTKAPKLFQGKFRC
jgi:hypothetical protein